MKKEKGFCEICEKEIEVVICCNGFDCGCRGLPTEPPVCSNACFDEFVKRRTQEKMKRE